MPEVYFKDTDWPDLAGSLEIDGSIDLTGTTATLFSGQWDNYDANNPFNGPLTIDSINGNMVNYSYAVELSDTAVVTQASGINLHIRFALSDGQEFVRECVQNIVVKTAK